MVRQAVGFTIIELMVVLGVIALISAIALYGLSQYNSTQPLDNAQKEFVTKLRSLQNQVVNGSDGVSVKSVVLPPSSNCTVNSCSYTVVNSYLSSTYVTTAVSLPKGVQFANLAVNPTAICLSNPNLTNFSAGQPCVTDAGLKRGCTSGRAFVCDDGTTPSINVTSPFEVVFSQGAAQRKVILEGSGMRINRIYAQ